MLSTDRPYHLLSQIAEVANSRRTDPARKNSKPGDSPLNYLYPGRPMSVYDSSNLNEIPNEHKRADQHTRKTSQKEADRFDQAVDKLAYEAGGGSAEAISPHPVVTPDDMVDVPEYVGISLEKGPSPKQQRIPSRENFRKVQLPHPTVPKTTQAFTAPHVQFRAPVGREYFTGSDNSSPDMFSRTMWIIAIVLLALLVIGLLVFAIVGHHREVPLT